jgi:hypothetical protein
LVQFAEAGNILDAVPDELAKPQPRFTITLGGSEWATIKYGIVEYLRRHPRMRAATAVVGVVWLIGWILGLAGYKWHFTILPAVSALFVSPTLLWCAVVSGPDFQLTFPAPKPDATAVTTSEPKVPLEPEAAAIAALNSLYDTTEKYARTSSRWAIITVIAALALGSFNVWLMLKRPDIATGEHTTIFIWSFVSLLGAIAIYFLVRSALKFRESARLRARLFRLQEVLASLSRIEKNPELRGIVDGTKILNGLLTPPAE